MPKNVSTSLRYADVLWPRIEMVLSMQLQDACFFCWDEPCIDHRTDWKPHTRVKNPLIMMRLTLSASEIFAPDNLPVVA